MTVLNETSQELIDIVSEFKDSDDNTILGKIVGAGVPFGKAKGVVDKIMVSQGFRMNKVDMDAKAEEILATFEISEETTAEEVQEQIDNLVDELNCKVPKARNYIKALFSGEEIAYPKATRAASATRTSTPGFNGDAKLVSDFLIENKDCTREEFDTFMKEQGKDLTASGVDKTGRWFNVLVDLKVFAEKYCAA